MNKIDGEKVAKIVSKCDKRLKVNMVMAKFVDTLENINAKNPVVKEASVKCGDELFGALEHTILTMFALTLLAQTHNSKEMEAIMKECQAKAKESEA